MLKPERIFILLITLASHYCNHTNYSPFEEVTKHKGFIDKTKLMQLFIFSVKELPHTAHMLISCPRLGKSVNLDMMKRFFEANYDPVRRKKTEKLFTDPALKLYVARDMFGLRRHFGQYHVIFLNFSSALGATTYNGIINSIHGEIRKVFETYRHLYDKKFSKSRYNEFDEHRELFRKVYSGEVGFDFTRSLVVLAEFLMECDVKKKIILLVDDFDRPFQIADDNKANPDEVARRIEALLTNQLDVYIYIMLTTPFRKNRKFVAINKMYYFEDVLDRKHLRPIKRSFGLREPELEQLYELYNVHSWQERDFIQERFRQFNCSVYNPGAITYYLETRDIKKIEGNR